MLWLPKWLHDNGARLEAEMPSRRRFLILSAAAAVAAVAPPVPMPFEQVRVDAFDRRLYGRVFIAGRRMGKTAAVNAWVQATKNELEATVLDVQARGLAGMVEHHGLYVPKDTPREIAMWRHVFEPSARQRAFHDQVMGEWAGQPAHDNTDYSRDCTWLGIDRASAPTWRGAKLEPKG